jgi:hypothetical protein
MEPLSSPAGQPGQISVKSIHSPLVAGGQEVEETLLLTTGTTRVFSKQPDVTAGGAPARLTALQAALYQGFLRITLPEGACSQQMAGNGYRMSHVALIGSSTRTQNGHIRNDTRDVSRPSPPPPTARFAGETVSRMIAHVRA